MTITSLEIATRDLSKLIDLAKAKEKYLPFPVFNVQGFGAKGDGKNDDTAAIQSALNEAESMGGGFIVFPNGVYNISGTLRIPSNTKLIGLGQVILKRVSETNSIMINKSDGKVGGYDANKNITVENIIFDGNAPNFTSSVTLLGFGHCSDITVKYCRFINNGTSWHDLELNACKDVLVYKCLFDGYIGTSEILQLDFAGSAGQFPWFGPYDDTACQNVIIEKCLFKDPISQRNKTAIGNHTFKSGVVTKNLRIKECVFEDMIYCVNVNDIEELYVENNKMFNCIFGVFFEEKANDSSVWEIRGNTFNNEKLNPEGFSDGRFFVGATFPLTKVFSDIKIIRNDIKNCVLHGIGFTSTRNVEISGNTIENCGRNGIYFFGGSDAIISNNICANNNQLSEPGRADIVVGNSPANSANVLVTGNNVGTMISGTNVTKAVYVDNIISTSFTNNSGAEGIVKNNLIAGVWTP